MSSKKFTTYVVMISILILTFSFVLAKNNTEPLFTDVPANHWAAEPIYKLRVMEITDGIGNNSFGMGLTINRNEFVAFLVKLMKWELVQPDKGSFTDNADKSKWFFPYIETALWNNAIVKDSESFRPGEPITREEMAVMIVRALGYDKLAGKLDKVRPFTDVERNIGYVAIAKDFGIIDGVGDGLFKPYHNAKREEAAAMIMRMFEKQNAKIEYLHGFYAIKSAEQTDMIKALDSVGFGWSRLEYNKEQNRVILNTTRNNNNEYAIPAGFSQPIETAKDSNAGTTLMVFAKEEKEPSTGKLLSEYIISQSGIRKAVIGDIIKQISHTSKEGISAEFDGVIVDFESLRGADSKNNFNSFLKELKNELDKVNKSLFVAIHPATRPGQAYFDGYDFRTIGSLADKVILMAHDYNAKQLTESEMQAGFTMTPLTPIEDIYWALKHITDKDNGVENTDKILVQLSFDSAQWKVKDGKVINKYPYSPDYEAIKQRLHKEDVLINYSDLFENPYATFYDNGDNTYNTLWYEDSRSINAKMNLIKMFGLKGVSIWRLGNIPDYKDDGGKKIYLDVWSKFFNYK